MEKKPTKLFFGNHQKRLEYEDSTFNNVITSTNCKSLGINLDQHLIFWTRIDKVSAKLDFFELSGLSNYLDHIDLSIILSFTLTFYMNLNSGVTPRMPHCCKSKCAKNATKSYFKQPPNSSVTCKFQESKIMLIKMLFKYQSIIFMYNLLKIRKIF